MPPLAGRQYLTPARVQRGEGISTFPDADPLLVGG